MEPRVQFLTSREIRASATSVSPCKSSFCNGVILIHDGPHRYVIALTREHISHPRCLRWRFDLSDPAAGRFKNTAFRTGKVTAFGTQSAHCLRLSNYESVSGRNCYGTCLFVSTRNYVSDHVRILRDEEVS